MGRTGRIPVCEPGRRALIKQDDVAPVMRSLFYHTADLLASIERVVLAGGRCSGTHVVPEILLETIALFIDSEGNRIGLHQPA